MNKIKATLIACAVMVLTANSAKAVILYGTSLERNALIKIDTNSAVVAACGTGCTDIKLTTPLSPDSLLIDPAFRLIYSENNQSLPGNTGEVHRVNADGTGDITLANGLAGAQDLVFDPAPLNSLLVGNVNTIAGNPTICRIDLGAAFPNCTPLTSSFVPRPNGMAYDNTGRLFVLGGFQCEQPAFVSFCGATNAAHLYQLNPTTGAILATSIAFDSTNTLDGLVFDPLSGALFATSRGLGILYKIDPTAFLANPGTYAPVIWATGLPVSGNNGPDGVMTDTKGLLYVAERGDFHVYSCSATVISTACTQLNSIVGLDDLAQLIINPPTITKKFAPNPILTGGVSTLTITIANPNPTTSLLNVSFIDTLPTLPAQVSVAATPNLSNTCTGAGIPGTIVGATAGSVAISMAALTGATIVGGGSCTIKVDVTAPVGTYVNTTTVASSNGGPGLLPGQDTLVVQAIQALTLLKTFANPTVPLGGTTNVTFTISNPNPTLTATGITLTDSLAGLGLTVSAGQASPFSACGGTVTAAGLSIGLAGGTLLPLTPCTFSVSVTGTTAGAPVSNCANVTSSITAVQTPQSCAPITVIAPPLIAKLFVPGTIQLNGTSTLTLTVTNPVVNAVALVGVSFTDPLPAGVLVAATQVSPFAACGGTVTATPNTSTISLVGGTLGLGVACPISVLVTGTSVGVKNNLTLPVTSTNGGPGGTATGQLTVIGPPLIMKAFVPPFTSINGSSTVVFTITNPNTITLTGVGFTDNLPVGMKIAATPNLINSCTGGTVTPPVLAGALSLTLAGATLNAGASCQVSVNVTTTSGGGLLCNTTTAVTSIEGGPGTPATACLTISPPADDVYQIRYAANLDKGDSIVNFTNAGTLAGTDPAGRICVNVYAFDPAEEIISCCACLVTPNGLATLSVNRDIMPNTLTPGKPTSIVIKLLASTPIGGTCNASTPTATNLVRGMRAWGTTLHALPTTPATYASTETPFVRAQLSDSELTKLSSYCGFIQQVGSGFGICASCQMNAQGGVPK